MFNYPLVMVRWRDHWYSSNEAVLDKVKSQMQTGFICNTVGYLVSEDAGQVVLVSEVSQFGDDPQTFKYSHYIQRPLIISIETLRISRNGQAKKGNDGT